MLATYIAAGVFSTATPTPTPTPTPSPNGEPVSLELAKLQIGLVDDDSRDDLINQFITASRLAIEQYISLALVRREFVEEHFPCRDGYLELYRGPDVELTGIGYIDADDAEQTYSGARLRATRRPARIYPGLDSPWPARSASGFVVTYEAGFAEGEVPEDLTQAMLLLIAHYWKYREAAAEGNVGELPLAVQWLCNPHRLIVI